MNICGVIAEYNPFHSGHAWHLQQARQGMDGLVCVMSGSWTQRGEPAVLDKWTRTAMALSGGADAVFELPVAYAVAPGPVFALGGVKLLTRIGCTHISFGCETPSLAALWDMAERLDNEDLQFQTALRAGLDSGMSFPRARYEAYQNGTHAEMLNQPNNILALCYLRALRRLNSPLIPVPVQRQGAGYHDANANQPYPSATALRRLLAETGDITQGIPSSALEIMRNALTQGKSASFEQLDSLILFKLRSMSKSQLAALPFVDEGMENRLAEVVLEAQGWDDLLLRLKHKRFVRTRLARILVWTLLDGDREWFSAHTELQADMPVRLLGFRREKAWLLKHFAKNTDLLVKAADYRACGDEVRSMFEKEMLATDVHSVLLRVPNRKAGRDMSERIVIV